MSYARSKCSLAGKFCQRTSPILGSKKQHKKINRSLKTFNERKTAARSYEDFDHSEKQDHVLKRNTSLPNIASICDMELYSSPWCKDVGHPHCSIKRSQSLEWEPVSALFTAIAEDDLDEMDKILQEYEIELNFLGTTGISFLHTAALIGSTKALQLLLNSGAQIDYEDINNRTSLEISLLAGNFDCAALLIENGACMNKIVDGIKVF